MKLRNLQKFLDDFYKEDEDGKPMSDKMVSQLTIDQLYKLIDLEIKGRASKSVLNRLHRRLSSERATLERIALTGGPEPKTNWRK